MSTSGDCFTQESLQIDRLRGNTDESLKQSAPYQLLGSENPQLSLPASFAELLDRLTILDLKIRRGAKISSDKLCALRAESQKIRHTLEDAYIKCIESEGFLENWYGQLFGLNSQLWDVEDRIRAAITKGDWAVTGPAQSSFLFNTMLVPYLNDLRSATKATINGIMHGDAHTEVKVYS